MGAGIEVSKTEACKAYLVCHRTFLGRFALCFVGRGHEVRPGMSPKQGRCLPLEKSKSGDGRKKTRSPLL